MNQEIEEGDLVEDCSLMPGVVMKIIGDDIQIRRLDLDYLKGEYSHCSLANCGIVKITAEDALDRLKLGKDRLTVLWQSINGGTMEDYYNLIKENVNK